VAEVKVPDKDERLPTHDGAVLRNIFEKDGLVLLESQIPREDPKPLLT